MAIDQSVINFAVYEDSVEYLGMSKVTLPDVTFLTQSMRDSQSAWSDAGPIGAYKYFAKRVSTEIADSAAFNGKLLDGTGVFVKFHCHILQMPV